MSILRNITIEAEKGLEKPELMLFIGARQSGKTTILKQLQEVLNVKHKITYFLNLEDPEFLIYGGYPKVVLAPLPEKKEILSEIGYSYVKKDIFESGVRHEETFYKFIKILASGIGGLVNFSEISATLGASKATLERYFHVLRKSFHISPVRPFYKNIRKELTKMSKVYFNDLGLRNFFVGNFDSPLVREDKGALMENAVFKQLIEKYDESEIKFWRTTSNNEVDFIIKDKDAFEVKINARQFNKKRYLVFSENYPEIDMKIAAYEIPDEVLNAKKNDLKELYLWQC